MWRQSKSTGKLAFSGFWGGVGMVGLGSGLEVFVGLCEFNRLFSFFVSFVGGVIRGWGWVSTNY